MNTLSIGGACASRELELGIDDLAAVDAIHQIEDVGRILDGRKGAAVRLSALKDLVMPTGEARFVHVESDDGSFTANLAIERALTHGLILYALNGEALPARFGGPFRLMLAEGEDCSVNVKYLARLDFVSDEGSHTANCADDAKD
ncbi:MAG: DMSO/TMAO reductase YedYZ molybdopterin-dependent catalytic subunit [Planctomycetota bacterium]|jgi:DMSO/TMAO reductase YedYZ molybdopterin-dependent catalytic subunit